MFLKTIDIPIYNFILHIIVIEDTVEDAKILQTHEQISSKAIKETPIEESFDTLSAVAVVETDAVEIGVIYLMDSIYEMTAIDDTAEKVELDIAQLWRLSGLVAHESLHLTHHILNTCGCKLTNSSEEAYTYLLQYITELSFEYVLLCSYAPELLEINEISKSELDILNTIPLIDHNTQ